MWSRLFVLGISVALCIAADDGQIVRPPDGAAIASNEVSVIATAPAGKLELDGKPVAAGEPFPNVLHAKIKLQPGEHTLALEWEGGRREITFFSGDNVPSAFEPFHPHPPLADLACTTCHGLSRRGRFRFQGGCFDCHEKKAFPGPHDHEIATLQECGMCHHAHGSTTKSHLTMPKELACKQCHN